VRRGSHRYEPERARWPFIFGIIVALAVVGVAVWYLLLQEGAPLGEEERGVPDFSFKLGKVGGSAVAERAPEETIRRATRGVRTTLDAMFVAGFVDPAKWQNATYPEVLEAFEEGTRDDAGANIHHFSLGGESGRVAFVEPRTGRLSVRFLIDAEGVPTGAVARTTFAAGGELRSGRPIDVIHHGVWYMRPDGRRWLVAGYDVEGAIGLATAGAQGGATP